VSRQVSLGFSLHSAQTGWFIVSQVFFPFFFGVTSILVTKIQVECCVITDVGLQNLLTCLLIYSANIKSKPAK